MSKKIRAFILNTGYVETASLADIFVYKDDGTGWDTPEEGLRQLMQDLVDFKKAEFLRYGDPEQCEPPDYLTEVEAEILAFDFITGNMQTHGQFLFDYGWNTNCWGEANPVVRIASAHETMAHLWLNKEEKLRVDSESVEVFELVKRGGG